MVSISISQYSPNLMWTRRFSGDESFDTTLALDAGSGLGVVIEGKKTGSPVNPSRL